MKKIALLFLTLCWFGSLITAGSAVLLKAASRVGESKASTYGSAYSHFKDSWGGEIAVTPPGFRLEHAFYVREYYAREYDKDAKAFIDLRKVEHDSGAKIFLDIRKVEQIRLVPSDIRLESTLHHGLQKYDWFSFDAFASDSRDSYTVINTTTNTGPLWMDLVQPEGANLVSNQEILLPGQEGRKVSFEKGSALLATTFKPGDSINVQLTRSTKGMDVFKYNISDYRSDVIQSLKATLLLNTGRFDIYRFGLPHKMTRSPDGTRVDFEIHNFMSSQDLGISFPSIQTGLERLEDMLEYSPCALVLYLLIIFVQSQIRSIHFHLFHYLFIAMVHVFYFLFIAYLSRFFGIIPTFVISTTLTLVMFLAYCPNVLGWPFATRIAGPFLFLLTVIFSAIFLAPAFRGILFVSLVFVTFLSIMIPISRSEIGRWPVMGRPAP